MDTFSVFVHVPYNLEVLMLLETFHAQWLIDEVPDIGSLGSTCVYAEGREMLNA
jgi:hypothetical protein